MSGEVRLLSVTGEIDMATVDQLTAALRDLLARRDTTEIVLDFADVTFCDATGIQALEDGYARAEDAGIRLRLVNPRRTVRKVLEITGSFDRLTG